jgi:hypothetical protein
MPRVLIPLSNYSVSLTSAVIIVGAALGGLAVVIARLNGRVLAAGHVLAGVVGLQVCALAHAVWAVKDGLETSTRAQVYLGGLAGGAALMIVIGIPILLAIARGHAAPVTLAVAASSVALGWWLLALMSAVVPISAQVPLFVWRTIEWLPAVITGIAIGWCGWRSAKRAVASVLAVVIIWVVPALVTAVMYGLGSRIYLQFPRELVDASKQVFRMALGSTGQAPQRVAITVVVAILVWFAFRAQSQESSASNP